MTQLEKSSLRHALLLYLTVPKSQDHGSPASDENCRGKSCRSSSLWLTISPSRLCTNPHGIYNSMGPRPEWSPWSSLDEAVQTCQTCQICQTQLHENLMVIGR